MTIARTLVPSLVLLGAGLLPQALTAQTPVSASAPATAPAPVSIKLDRLEFMAGCWVGELGEDLTVEENWSSPTDNMLLATTRYLDKKKQATGWEFTRVVSHPDSGTSFIAAGNGKPEDSYALVRATREYVLFENLAKPFPQQISYRKASDGALIARNEGAGQLSVEVRFERARCPGDRR